MTDDTDTLPPRRQPGETMDDWRPRRDALARQLAGLAEPETNGAVETLRAQLVEAIHLITGLTENQGTLRGIVEEQAEMIGLLVSRTRAAPAETPRLVDLADGRRFAITGRDVLTLCLGVTVAARTGGAVDLPLADGTVAEALRIGELAEISAQLIGPPE